MAKLNCNFISYTLNRTVDITVVVPSVTIPEAMTKDIDMSKVKEGEEPTAKQKEAWQKAKSVATHKKEHDYPVLYLLHGYGNNHATWSGYTTVELFAEERNIAVVMISGENKFYIDHENEKIYTFIEEELRDFVCHMFPVSDKPEHTYIAGLSMGGYGALIHGLGNPEKYAAYGAFSAAVKMDSLLMIANGYTFDKEKYDPKTILLRQHKEGKKLPKAFVACGENDFLYEDNKAFIEGYKEINEDVTWVSVEGYEHEWRFWHLMIERFLDWIPRTDFYASERKRKI